VLVARRDQLRGDQRRRFVARCATGDWDGIVMSRSSFERIPLSPGEQAIYLQRELDQTREWLNAAKGGAGLTVKRLQAALLRAEERLKAKLDSAPRSHVRHRGSRMGRQQRRHPPPRLRQVPHRLRAVRLEAHRAGRAGPQPRSWMTS
jgi:hypothetical protein